MSKRTSQADLITPDTSSRDYETLRPRFLLFTRKLHALVEELLDREAIRHSVVESRCKEVDNFREKISRPGKQYADPCNDITDLAGVRVILYYTDDIERVGALIRAQFTVDESASQDKAEELEPQEFGYRSVHYVISLNDARSCLPEWRDLVGLKAEIQVRTVLQHAWASNLPRHRL